MMCFVPQHIASFDDSVHEILGIKDDKFQSLYHFTVGKPLEVKRLETLSAYEYL